MTAEGRETTAGLEGWALVEAEKHQPDDERGGCTCGFCVWSVDHVVVMSVRYAELREAEQVADVLAQIKSGAINLHKPHPSQTCKEAHDV